MSVIQINGVRVHTEVFTTKFACDYQVCKGGCCYVENDKGIVYEGCEITEDEESLILSNTATLGGLLEKDGRCLPKKCTYEKDGEHYITCDAKGRCCLQLSTGCALREAQRKDLIDYGNPIACDLYPLVVTKMGRVHLRVGNYYDEFHLCDAAYERGERENIYLIDFCKDALIRHFGGDFYGKLLKQARKFRTE